MTEPAMPQESKTMDRASVAALLRAEEERFRMMVEAVQDYALYMLDLDGNVATWNPGAESLKGYRAEEIIGRHFSQFFPREDVESGKPDRELQAVTREGRFEVEGWRIRKDASRFWAHVVTTAIRDHEGALIGFAKATRDETVRHKATERFRLALEAAPTGMLMVDRAGKISLVNVLVEQLFGYAREELIGKPIEMLLPERFRNWPPGYRTGFFDGPKAQPMGQGRVLYGLRKNGTEVPIEIGLNPLQTPEGDFVLGSVADITERKRGEQEREDLMLELKTLNADLEERVRVRTSELTASLKEREVLLREVHHRVKNNLQVISSLINMQVRRLEEGRNREALVECQMRVQAIALIHEKLYQSQDYSRVPFAEYVRGLASNVFHATGVSPSKVSLELAVEDLTLAVNKAIPCGLVLNELITNALKHAFSDGRKGTIRVELAPLDGGRLLLVVSDDGVGLPVGLDVWKAESLGLQLVCTLSEQLDAVLEVKRGRGTSFQLTFPAEA